MADNKNQSMDLTDHRASYELFLWLCKWTVIIVAVVLVLMAIFLV